MGNKKKKSATIKKLNPKLYPIATKEPSGTGPEDVYYNGRKIPAFPTSLID